jgi:hypothetical protein
MFLFSFRSTPHEKSNLSPAEDTFVSPLVLPAQFPFSPDDDSFHFLRNLQSSLSGSLSQPSTDSKKLAVGQTQVELRKQALQIQCDLLRAGLVPGVTKCIWTPVPKVKWNGLLFDFERCDQSIYKR